MDRASWLPQPVLLQETVRAWEGEAGHSLLFPPYEAGH